jgi:hypothetical protein
MFYLSFFIFAGKLGFEGKLAVALGFPSSAVAEN